MTIDLGTTHSDGRNPGPYRELTAPVPPGPRAAPEDGRAPGVGRSRRLWSRMPRKLAREFRPHADAMARSMVQEIQRVIPEYQQPLEGPFGEMITQAVQQAILYSLDNIGDPAAPQENWITLFRHLGKVEFREGRSLDCLQTAYRVGGRVAWRHVAKFGQTRTVSPEILCVCAEAIFAYVDEISALSIAGYTEAQANAVGTMARRRRRLLELILSDPPASTQAISGLATAARWELPEQVTMIALEPRSDQHELSAPRFDDDVLVDLEGSEPCLLTADPDRDLAWLECALTGWRAAVGPRVRLTDAAVSLRWARRTMALVQRGVAPDAAITRCADHLVTLWLLTDEFLIQELSVRSLAPMRGLTVKQRARLSETLLAWLQSRDSAPELAAKLGVHPQTIRYRMHQLEQLFGDRLNDADERLNLEIALRAERLTGKL
jgi:hypothetical protein